MTKRNASTRPTDADIRAAIDMWDNHLFWENLGRGRISILENIDPQEPINVASTAFMRYGEFFGLLAPHLGERHPQGLHALSACCSAGAEAYSLALSFKNVGLRGYAVTAFDRSSRLCTVARAGVYPAVMAFGLKGKDRQHFVSIPQDGRFMRVSEAVRKNVHVLPPIEAQKFKPSCNIHVSLLFNTLIHLNYTLQLQVADVVARATEHMFCFNVYDRRDAKAFAPVLDARGFVPVDAVFKPTNWENAGTCTEKGFDGQADTVVACIRMKEARSYTI